MRINLEIPDTTKVLFINYAFAGREEDEAVMASMILGEDELEANGEYILPDTE